jgi:hypothetical protein
MNTPEKAIMHTSIYYLPRNTEMLHENYLFENKMSYRQKILKDKLKLKQLSGHLINSLDPDHHLRQIYG